MVEEITEELIHRVWDNPRVRQHLAFKDPFWFSLLYLREHFSCPFAPFQLEMFHLISEEKYTLIEVMAFRESGKTTILNLANVLWSVLGAQEKKFIIIVSKTLEQAKNHFANIQSELENNTLLINDFGPFIETKDVWNKTSLELVYCGAKIMCVTLDQSIRGMKYKQHRPDLIICDDLEDTSTLKVSNDIYRKFKSEIIPVGTAKTRIFVLGNLLDKRSFMMQLKEKLPNKNSIFRAYPLLDDRGKNLWRKKFSNKELLEDLNNKASQETWSCEYLLNLSDRWPSHHRPDSTTYDWSTNEPQRPLIKQMKQFKISAPFTEEFREPEKEDRRFSYYQQYVERLNELLKIHLEKMRKELDDEINAMPDSL